MVGIFGRIGTGKYISMSGVDRLLENWDGLDWNNLYSQGIDLCFGEIAPESDECY